MTLLTYKISWTTLLTFAIFLIACNQSVNTKSSAPIKTSSFANVDPDTSTYAIIPDEEEIHLRFGKSAKIATLTKEELSEIEILFKACITNYNSKIHKNHELYDSIDLTNNLKRQYVAAINEKGQKEVWINCFCKTDDHSWRTTIIQVEDGGNCYFNLKINLTTKKCYDIMVNGIA